MKWTKIKKYSQKAGKEVLAIAEATYLTMMDPTLSRAQKMLLVSAITYLMLPVDAYPDFLPAGFADDLTIMLSALATAGKVGKKHLQECRLKHGLVAKEDRS